MGLSSWQLIQAGLWRKPWRTLLTGASIAIAFVLIGLLEGVNAGFADSIAAARRDLLTTDALVRGSPPFPIALMEKIKQVPGVVQVAPRAYFVADYRPPYGVAAIATQPRDFFELRPALSAPTEYVEAMRQTLNGLLATPALMNLYDWNVGDTVTLRSRERRLDGSGDWPFTIVGTFDAIAEPGVATFAIINYDYLDGARAMNRGTIERIYLRIDNPEKSIATAAAIDAMFANSSHATRTRSDQARAESDATQLGEVAFFTNAVIGAVLFALLFVTANTVRQSLRERTAEFGVLKAIGFSDARCVVLACGESLLICVTAAVCGLGLAALAAPLAGDLPIRIAVSVDVLIYSLLLAIGVALISAALPCWRLYRASVIQSLAAR